ncbi:uncharacterized protein N7518_001138 [Penicillium psychrosexuale]|uniref:uncharacterized protein n=1 Tax=Penicillium psychrosexuale TaxID=1002107 RepID=UPI002544FBA4|nr:uncharacterized protein N7518_001138 [Penicillium psychrosexuale]KAJ5799070.1 hypothetical protein N7518_001138 [Penicillium psychrosexuale]
MAAYNAQDSYQGSYRAGTITMTVLGVLFVILRFLARWKKSLKPGLDDYFIVLALFPLLALVGLMLSLTNYGMGLHSQVLPLANIIMIAKLLLIFEIMYVTTVATTKISILLMYCRIFPTREIRIASLVLGGMTLSWLVAIILVSVFQCNPIPRAWDTRIPGKCINLKGMFIGNAVPNIVTDILILSLPVKVVWGLHASLTHRLVVFTSAYRFATIFGFDPTDIAWTLGRSCTWCVVESSTGVISACMPTLRPLFMIVSSKFSSRSGTRSRTTDIDQSKGYELDNSALRPANEPRNKTRTQLEVSHADDGSEDEVPLNSIRVQQYMTWQESRGDSFRGYK